MLPPFPPSPPEGPPLGTYFSLRNATHPLPPSPAFTQIFASSTNMPGTLCPYTLIPCTIRRKTKTAPAFHRGRRKLRRLVRGLPRLSRADIHKPPALAPVLEL